MDKRILKEITKRVAKSILLNSTEIMIMDEKDVLTEEELLYIQNELEKIANRITDKPQYDSFTKMLSEYYEF